MEKKLYLLRMNCQGTQVDIEEYDLAKHDELSKWFEEKELHWQTDDPFKEWKLVAEAFGEDRIIHFTLRKDDAKRYWQTFSETLKEYYNCVEKTEELLRVHGPGNVRHEQSKENIALCSISDIFYVYEKPFVKLVYRLGNRFRTDAIFTEYDIPCWKLEFIHSGGLSVHERKLLRTDQRTLEQWMQLIMKEPDGAETQKRTVIERISKLYGIQLTQEQILYDPTANCYLLKEDAGRSILGNLMPEAAGDIKEIAKYTSFESLIAILESGKIRMNSIVSMNDKTETDFLGDVIRNYEEDYEQEDDKYLFADKEFITSFTSKIDDLDMWRLYGDNARGACMVFERDAKQSDDLYKIRYIDPQGKDIAKVSELMVKLKEMGIRFRLNCLQKYRHFLKHVDYCAEEESRLLVFSEQPDGWFINRDNGILTPYMEKALNKAGRMKTREYPFRLRRIILGPSIKEKDANLMQVFYMSHQYGYYLSVEESRINSYR